MTHKERIKELLDRGCGNEEICGFQRKKHTQTDAVCSAASREA